MIEAGQESHQPSTVTYQENQPALASRPDNVDSTLHSSQVSPLSNDPKQTTTIPEPSAVPPLPVPLPSPANPSKFPLVFSSALIGGDIDLYGPDPLPSELANADISVAPDGSFVETSSALAARELKKRYDQFYGVNKDVRSPYAITAFVNQHGRQMFRVSHRNLSAPATSGVEAEQRASQAVSYRDSVETRTTKRRPRMSVHTLLHQAKAKNGVSHATHGASASHEHAAIISSVSSGTRKLRKTRSIPDMFGFAATTSTMTKEGHGSATGRAHSQSVTAVDMPRVPPAPSVPAPSKASAGDIFAEFMQWDLGSVPPSPFGSITMSENSSFSGDASVALFDKSTSTERCQPFGPGVSFESPSGRPMSAQLPVLPMPHMLREMQSFESGLTARVGDIMRRTGTPDSLRPSTYGLGDQSPSTPQRTSVPVSPEATEALDWDFTPLPETCMHSRYSTEVFDVLQTYRGLPHLEKLSSHSGETTIKMSVRAEDSAAPRDDPRFVLWGETNNETDADDLSVSHDSRAGVSSVNSRASRKSARAARSEKNFTDALTMQPSQKVIIAGTIERWIAQLTSELNYDELLNFFLTYRTYISAVDLCHLLICRFHWSLLRPLSKQDEMVRRIVRVRTFLALRYWLLTFFRVDFLPNRELRLLLASWLNTLIRDPILKKHVDGVNTVSRLIKVVKDCKEACTRERRVSTSTKGSKNQPDEGQPSHVLGGKFAEAVSQEDSDIDLDFVPDDGSSMTADTFNDNSIDIPLMANRTTISSASVAILQQSLQTNIMQQTRMSPPSSGIERPPLLNPDMVLSPGHNTLSRVFVRTIGRLGRWKRVLNSRAVLQSPTGVSTDVSAFELDFGENFTSEGGVERLLRTLQPRSASSSAGVSASVSPSEESNLPSVRSILTANADMIVSPPLEDSEVSRDASISSPYNRGVTDSAEMDVKDRGDSERQSEDGVTIETTMGDILANEEQSSLRSTSTSSFGSILSSTSKLRPAVASVNEQPPWQFDVVSIDDLDLSDTSSAVVGESPSAHPGLRKMPRRLPLRRDFEFVRRSRESVSSMGIRSHDSVTSGSSAVSSMAVGVRLGGGIHQWQMNALVDSLSDDEEPGDVEDALRRLEGQINQQKKKEKASKVDGWVRTIQERMAAGDYGDDRPRYPDDDDGGGGGGGGGGVSRDDSASAKHSDDQDSIFSREALRDNDRHLAGSSEPNSAPVGPTSPPRTVDAKPDPEDAVPLEILQSRMPSRPSTLQQFPSESNGVSMSAFLPKSPQFATPTSSPYKSWILDYSVESLVQHFTIIDRELFLGIKPEELVMDDWQLGPEVNVLDWAQYLKDRARWKAESRWGHKTSALAAVRARFNLIASFTLSEIVLTHPHERPFLVSKFIRIALKAYMVNNFNTLVAILAGLRSEWITKAMRRHWSRVGIRESQCYKNLTQFASPAEDFRAIRAAVLGVIDAKPMTEPSHVSSVTSASLADNHPPRSKNNTESALPPTCIPFIGIFLSQLHRYSKLPDLIDPTAPDELLSLDSHVVNFELPAHPDVFDSLTPLPPSMQLEPLINIHKQRLIAGVIKKLVAAQHFASRVRYPADKKLFQKCLKLRGLDSDTLQRAYALYPERETLF